MAEGTEAMLAIQTHHQRNKGQRFLMHGFPGMKEAEVQPLGGRSAQACSRPCRAGLRSFGARGHRWSREGDIGGSAGERITHCTRCICTHLPDAGIKKCGLGTRRH
jgi:hypothetical protein